MKSKSLIMSAMIKDGQPHVHYEHKKRKCKDHERCTVKAYWGGHIDLRSSFCCNIHTVKPKTYKQQLKELLGRVI